MPRTTAPTMPPVTLQHLLHAYLIIRPIGVSFEAVLQRPACDALRRVVECKAAQLLADAWNAVTNPTTTISMIDKERIQQQARRAASLYHTLNDACPYPFGSEAGRVFKEEFLAERAAKDIAEQEKAAQDAAQSTTGAAA